jgi:flagellar protein FlbD
VIAVTCRNGEHFSVDPDAIERIETDPDTVVILADGSKYVVAQSFDELLSAVRDHRAAAYVSRARLVDGFAATPAAVRAARHRSRNEVPITVVPSRDED